jgi:dTDP-4-dehydrorhamnose reductase
MKVLVIGATGMLGQDLVKVFLAAGHDVVSAHRPRLDIAQADSVEKVFNEETPDLVVNAAAYNFVDLVEDPTVYPLAYAINVTGPKNLAEAAAKRNIPFVHYSTDYVFSGEKVAGYTEDDQPQPISKYGETKYLGEQAVQAAGGKWFVIRVTKLFGTPGTSADSKQSFVSLMLRLAAEKPELKIVNEQVGLPTYTPDVARATLALVTGTWASGIYHFVNEGVGVTPYGFAEEIFALKGVRTPRTAVTASAFGAQAAARPNFAVLMNTKFPPLRSREEALRDFLKIPIPMVAGHGNVRLSVVIVSLNVREILRENLARMFSLREKYSFEVIVVDNGSTDGSVAMMREHFPQVHIIQNDYNSGFSHACNQGTRIAQGEVIVLFNPDMLMGEGVLSHTYETLTKERDIGIMGVKLLAPDGSIVRSVRRDPSFVDQFAILSKLSKFFPHLTDRYLAMDFDYSRSQNVEQVRGSYFAFRRDVIDSVGMMDERYFVWFEEVDLCVRVRRAGYRIWYDASVQCTDIVGQYFKQVPTRIKQYNFMNSMRKYFKKWHPFWQSMIIAVLLPLAVAAGACFDAYRWFTSKRT